MTDISAKAQIVIVNWNAGAWLGQCLESVAAHGGALVDRVVVVDNGSTDGSADQPGRPGLEVIRAGENLGFARACNLGAKGAVSEYLLFLNPDAAIGPETIATRHRLHGERHGEEGRGLRHPLIESMASPAPGHRFSKPSSIFKAPLDARGFRYLHSRPVDHVAGAFYLMRRRVFEQLNGFDEILLRLSRGPRSVAEDAQARRVGLLSRRGTAFHKAGARRSRSRRGGSSMRCAAA